MSHQLFTWQHRVSYAECTLGNHVYHARFLDLLERVRGEFFRQVGVTFLSLQEQDVIFPVVECRLKFRGPAQYDDVVTVQMWVSELERVRVSFVSRVTNGAGALLLDAMTSHACTRIHGKVCRIPCKLAEALRPYLETSPQFTEEAASSRNS